jgi:hypothetical protein
MKIKFTSVFFLAVFNIFAQENPFESIGKQGKVLTLSNGKYKEIHSDDSLQQIGSVIVNLNTGKIHGFLEIDTLYSEATLDPTVVSRWYSLDPKAEKFASVSPYVSFNDNPIYYVDPDGGENIPALIWAMQHLANKGIESDYDEGRSWYGDKTPGGWVFQQGVIPTRMVCYEACFISYMHSGGNITPLLKTGFASGKGGFNGRSTEKGGENWFKAGDGSDRSFVPDIAKGELGDIIFMGEPGPMDGHSALLASIPEYGTSKNKKGEKIETMTLKALTTSSTSDPGNFGEKTWTFEKQTDGTWKQNGGSGYIFRGYGQLNEDNYKGDPSLTPNFKLLNEVIENKKNEGI